METIRYRNPGRRRIAALILILTAGAGLALGESEGPSAAHRGVVSWGDAVVTCGPGTDPAMDSPQAVANWMGDGKGATHNPTPIQVISVCRFPPAIFEARAIRKPPCPAWEHSGF